MPDRFIHPIRGRDDELERLDEVLDKLLSGVSSVVLVEGGAGMGKSRLLGEVVEIARGHSIKAGVGVSDPDDSMVQMATLMQGLFHGSSPILERLELRDEHASVEQRYWLIQDLEAMLEKASLASPLLICLDDLQWSDAGTIAALRTLPGLLSTLPIVWLLAYRPGQDRPELHSALRTLELGGAIKIVLGPLEDRAVARVAADILLSEPGYDLLQVATSARGAPYLLVELLSGLREEDLVRVESGVAHLIEARLPKRVTENMRSRTNRLSTLARRAAQVAAVMGKRFSVDDVAAVLDVTPSALLESMEELVGHDLLVEQGGNYSFSHDIVLEAVRESMSASTRKALDRQAASALLNSGALPIEVASRLAASAERGDGAAIRILYAAALAIEATDPGTAADLGKRALDLTLRNDELRGPLIAHTAAWLHASGRVQEASAFADTALRGALPANEEAEVYIRIAGMFAISPDVRADACRRGLALSGVSEQTRLLLSAHLFHNLSTGGRHEDAHALLAELETAVRMSLDIPTKFVVELARSGVEYVDGDLETALQSSEQALRIGASTNDDARMYLSEQWRCDVLASLDRAEESLDRSTHNVMEAERNRQGWALKTFEIGRGRRLLQLGRLSDAATALEGQFQIESSDQVVSIFDASGVVALGRVAIHMGNEELAAKSATIAEAMFERGAPSVQIHGAWLLALLAMSKGDAPLARETLRALERTEKSLRFARFPMDVADEVYGVRIGLAVGDREFAEKAAGSAEAMARLNPSVPSIRATERHAHGLLHRDIDDLVEACELFETGPFRLAFASALEDLGAIAVELGKVDQGVDGLGRALEVYAEAGANWDARRVRGRLRALGIRRRLLSNRRPDRGWGSLTESEVAVANLVAQGLSNKEVAERLFISHHTVGGHLRHVFAKLHINSRVELARLASAHEMRPRGNPST
ncbi:MAG TPA: AAA family ATPase [Acidimicrobiales bacterium]|nr:AAA family ATPase [Acidimicrobiales bacterium]